ncbi:hypothetical protein HMPREF9209_0717 [Lactobacillus gasseri 224-1]|uniref:Uncharacterized protein n=1 Tax=Lactobacillus gasseri 224-1 TaxID=679196 RepID=D1YI03_LACGS|nr:hypothetical protein HMPREF9209_0717 [Lactobacillus gasseri 224-1]
MALDDLLTQAYDLVQASSYDDLANSVNELQRQGKVVVSGDKAALQGIFQTELDISNELKRLVKNRVEKEKFSDEKLSMQLIMLKKNLKLSMTKRKKSY